MTQIKCPICGENDNRRRYETIIGQDFFRCGKCNISGPTELLTMIGKSFSDYIDEDGNVTGRMFWDGTKWINVWGSGGE